MKIFFIVSFYILCFLAPLYANNFSSNIIVGILEDNREELVNWKEGPSKNRIIRPLFAKKGNEWIVSPELSEGINWTITFEGKKIGIIKSYPHKETDSSLISTGIHVPDSKNQQNLIIGKPSKKFSGWLYTNVNRPLVLVSNENFNAPDKWKPFQPSNEQLKFFKSKFRVEYPKVINCDENEMPLSTPWRYEDTSIMVNDSYIGAKGDILVNMYLDGCKCGISDGPFENQLFLIRANKTVDHIVLKSNRQQSDKLLSLAFIDAGDYDADGETEVIFFLSGYNEDGYAIFYDSFRKNVIWTWGYH